MKKLWLVFAGCLAFIWAYSAHADDINDTARAAVRRGSNVPVVSSRQKTDFTPTSRAPSDRSSNVVARTASVGRNTNIVDRSADTETATPTNVVARTATQKKRAQNTAPLLSPRTVKITSTRSNSRNSQSRTTARAAIPTATREDVLNRDYSRCKNVFNECMDEFCANKDGQLKRCACSARIGEFNRVKKQLEDIDEKMLDFNQRLLTVSMDEKDAAAINIATEGEKAFYDTTDKSESKKTLDAIANKLNTSFDTSNFSTTLGGALSWSLDADSAFDNIDSLRGASTTAKSGTALYSAALPICREMAAEVCSTEDMAIAESGYQVLIEQDCNTVEKTYKNATDQARTKVLESASLLDISRLNVYQKNNADDILTCKKKMLAMLSDPTVCGENLSKCLDITGQYIDPSTGQAFLSSDLADLGDLITRPDDNQSWTSVPSNSTFVLFLNSKKKFLEPAMDNCREISDTVWDSFVEDALSQIKIAQLRKLEDVRQSCTTLTAQCLSNAIESMDNFDVRALSSFGVVADATVNAMCESVLSSCTTLLSSTDTDMEWYTGMTGIQNDITYSTIKQTCAQVGRACIIQVCTSTSGNFGLCENIDTSINRKSVINRDACWTDVLDCVRSAGSDTISNIFTQNNLGTTDKYKLYSQIYNINSPTRTNGNESESCVVGNTDDNSCIYDICYDDCDGLAYKDSDQCRVCRLAESIWGNCESAPVTSLTVKGSHNRIKVPGQNSQTTTLLYWFAQNTGTESLNDNCRDTTCGAGFTAKPDTNGNIMCIDSDTLDSCGNQCTTNKISISDSVTNCCNDGSITDDLCVHSMNNANLIATFTIGDGDTYYPAGNYEMYCTGTMTGTTCNGNFIIKQTGTKPRYMDPHYNGNQPDTPYVRETFSDGSCTTYTHKYNNGSWGWYSDDNTTYGGKPTSWTVSFGN